MAKYIDADRLKAKLDEHYRKYQSKYMETRNPYTQGLIDALDLAEQVIDSLQQEQPEMDLKKFTEKMNAWKARYNYPDNIPIKAAMAFTARMFYQYPNVARQWYDSLPKVTMD